MQQRGDHGGARLQMLSREQKYTDRHAWTFGRDGHARDDRAPIARLELRAMIRHYANAESSVTVNSHLATITTAPTRYDFASASDEVLASET
jgi:hypothetical protein